MTREFMYITLFIIIVLASPLISLPNILKILRLRRTTTYWISSIPESGPVEVFGKAKGAPIKSKYGARDCLVWKLKVEERHRDSKGHESWSTVYRDVSKSPFVIGDDTGEVPVSVRNIDLDVRSECDEYPSLTTLESWGVSTKNFIGMEKTFRITEYLVLPGDELFLNGEADASSGHKEISGITHPLVISTSSERGVLSSLYTSVVVTTLIVIGIGAVALFFLYSR